MQKDFDRFVANRLFNTNKEAYMEQYDSEELLPEHKSEAPINEVKDMLKQVGLPPLMLPGAVVKVDELPKLGSGKADVQTGKKIAMERLGISG